MKVLVTGGTGLIGSRLIRALTNRGDEVVALTRNPGSDASRAIAAGGVTLAPWPDAPGLTALAGTIDAAVNLAGEPIVGKRWSAEQQVRIRSSRIGTTKRLFDAVRAADPRPRVVVSGSAIGYYGSQQSGELKESDPPGIDFLAQVCRDWEAATQPPPEGVRVVRARIGIVLAAEGGALPKMALPFKFMAGGRMGSGSQWVSWIHIEDMVGLMLLALDSPRLEGPVNFTAPEPVTNTTLSALLGRVLHRPNWLPVPRLALKLAAGKMSEAILSGQRVIPDAALAAGYQFKYPRCEEALRSLLE